MDEIAKRVWREPAVAVGLLTSIVLAIVAVVSGDSWDVSTIAGIAGPLVAALGIRPFVTPDMRKDKPPVAAP